MIRSFAHKGLRRFFERGDKVGIHPTHAKRLRLILGLLHAATAPQDLAFPGSALHPLHGGLEGHWAVRVSGPSQWSIAHDVSI
jgi:proteic killer suppression protein